MIRCPAWGRLHVVRVPSNHLGGANAGPGPASGPGIATLAPMKNLEVRVGILLGAGFLISTGCGDVDQSAGETDFDNVGTESLGTESEALRGQRWYRSPRGGTGGSSTTGGTAPSTGGSASIGGTTSSSGSQSPSCSICATTQSCCEAVNAGALCTFSEDTCESLDPLRKTYYARHCLMVLRTTISAQTMRQRAAPAACYLSQ